MRFLTQACDLCRSHRAVWSVPARVISVTDKLLHNTDSTWALMFIWSTLTWKRNVPRHTRGSCDIVSSVYNDVLWKFKFYLSGPFLHIAKTFVIHCRYQIEHVLNMHPSQQYFNHDGTLSLNLWDLFPTWHNSRIPRSKLQAALSQKHQVTQIFFRTRYSGASTNTGV